MRAARSYARRISSRSATLVAVSRPPGKSPITFGMPPDLFGLTDATSKRSRSSGLVESGFGVAEKGDCQNHRKQASYAGQPVTGVHLVV